MIKNYHTLTQGFKLFFSILFFLTLPSLLFAQEAINFTKEEIEWIKKQPPIKVGGGPDWAPFDFVNSKGEYSGVGNDYLNLISKKTGLKFDIIVDKWSNNLQKCKNSEIDLLHAVYYTDNRTEFMDYTEPYFEMLDYFFVRDDLDVKTMEDLNGKRVAIPKGYAHNDLLKREFPLIKIVTVDTFSQTIDAVLENRADMLFDTYVSLTYILKKEGISTIVPFKSFRGHSTVKLHMSTPKKRPMLLSVINKTLNAITQEEKNLIQSKWVFQDKKTQEYKLKFSKEEKEWIAKNPTVTYSEINWEPMSIIKEGTMVGVMNEYLKKIAAETGLTFKYKDASSWPDVIEKFKDKEIDIIPGIGASDFEAKLGLTSNVYANFPFVLVTKSSESYIQNIDELEGKTIAVPKYWTSYNYLIENRPGIKVIPTGNIFEALNKVKEGEAYAFLGHTAIGMHYVGNYYPSSLHISGKVEYNFNHKILIQQENKILLSIINKVIRSISEKEHLNIRNKWLHVEVKTATDYTLIYQIAFILLLIILGTFYWNRKLSKEIQERKQIQEALNIEKENFQVLFEKVSDGNLIIQGTKFVRCNKASQEMLGLTSIDKLLHSSPNQWSPNIQPDGTSSATKSKYMMSICLEKGAHRFEWVHKDINAKEFWVDVGLTKIVYEEKEAIFVVWRDISEQKSLEISLKKSEEQIRMLIDNIPLHVIVSRYDGEVLLANPQTLRDYNFEDKSLSGLNVLDFYADSKQRDEVLLEIQTAGKIEQKIVQLKRHDGVYSMMLSVLPIVFGGSKALLSIGVDLTERLELEKDLLLAKENAELANKSKSEFLANMSHEIRTPMNAIVGFTELLSEQIEEPRLRAYTKTIQSASNSLLTLINDILDLSKIEAGKLKINKIPTNVYDLSNEISSIFTMSIQNKNLDLIVQVDKSIPKGLLLDEVRLRQVLFNLIGNAVKFTKNGYIKLGIKSFNIDGHRSKLDLEISVEDSGVGIKEDQLKKIFNQFEQSDGQDNREFGGTGLGLSISKRLCEMMDGKISVESEVQKGATFIVHLYNVDISAMMKDQTLKENNSIKGSDIYFKKAKILVVDDIENNRELVIKNFENSLIEIVTANDGLEAIQKFKSQKPDLILMDIRMPIMDGYESATEIKKISDVPIVALTASVMEDEYERSKREHFDGFLRKPVLKADLYSELSKFLEHEKKERLVQKEDKIVLSDKAKVNLPTVLTLMTQNIMPQCNKALKSNSISDAKMVVLSTKELATKYDVEVLQNYANELYEAVDLFDIMKIESLLKKFNEIEKKLSEY